MTREELQQQIQNATKLVESWPQWKRNILIQNAQPTVSTPRPPINNQSVRIDEIKDK